MALTVTRSFRSVALAVILALPIIGLAVMESSVNARCPVQKSCLGNYSTSTFEGTAIGYSLSYYYCEQAKAEAQFNAQADLMTKGTQRCGDFKDACGQRWVHDAGCYSEDLGNGTYRFRMYGHYTFGCMVCSPWTPMEQDGGGD